MRRKNTRRDVDIEVFRPLQLYPLPVPPLACEKFDIRILWVEYDNVFRFQPSDARLPVSAIRFRLQALLDRQLCKCDVGPRSRLLHGA